MEIFSGVKTLFPKAPVSWLVEEVTYSCSVSGNAAIVSLGVEDAADARGIASQGFRKQKAEGNN